MKKNIILPILLILCVLSVLGYFLFNKFIGSVNIPPALGVFTYNRYTIIGISLYMG
jgi:hypothetical protein